ncbi:ubiquitin domain-containing protein UBFD1-like [Pecten maximus]|uniref:ubiquitin domain-containing protein UBFD1-like n=1 Tax=Pecten maximus TaxID=6579 RepID=UPI001458B46E|nr:ubiquitin domain-containing protein UBFD1-like [Pecten maximus]
MASESETPPTEVCDQEKMESVSDGPQKIEIECQEQPDKPDKATDPGGQGQGDVNQNQTEASSSETPDDANAASNTKMEEVEFKLIYKKQKYDVSFPMDNTIKNLKEHVETLTGVPAAMQKIMFKGLAKDECTLRDLKVTKGSKIMVVGSTLNDVLSMGKPSAKELEADAKSAAAATKESLSKQKDHKKVLEKYGKPDDCIPGHKSREPLPHQPIAGMYNKSGGKVRLTFKLELDQVWIGTKERTDKIPMSSIKAIVSEAIEGHEEYHMLGIQLGPTEASRYWIYWVPAQYVEAIKETVLGKWQYF